MMESYLSGTGGKQEREGEYLRSGSKTQGPLQTESHLPCLSEFLVQLSEASFILKAISSLYLDKYSSCHR